MHLWEHQERVAKWTEEKGWNYSSEDMNPNVRYLARAAREGMRLADALDQVRDLRGTELYRCLSLPKRMVQKRYLDASIVKDAYEREEIRGAVDIHELGLVDVDLNRSSDPRKDWVLMKLVLIMTEVGEAIEAVLNDDTELRFTESGKPEGMASEVADIVIRCLSMMDELGLDTENAVRQKMVYNDTRAHKHGGKKA